MPPAKRQKVAAAESAPRTVVHVSGDGRPSKLVVAELWKSETFCDINVEVEGQVFAAHRLVLASSSDYMRALLCENRFSDSSEAQIKLPDMPATAFEHVLNWIYLDACDIDEPDLLEVLEVASRLQCTSLITQLETMISKRVAAESCLAMWDAGERMGLETLVKESKAVAISWFDEVSKLDDFKDLSSEKVLELVSSNTLHAPKEEDVFSSVIEWTKAQKECRQATDLEKIIQHVRFPLMSTIFIDNHVETEQLLLENPACMIHVARSFREQLFAKKREWTMPREGVIHKKLIRQQQQRLIILHHASRCSLGSECATKCCSLMVTLWRHMKHCRDKQCRTPHCFSSRCVLKHYRTCKAEKRTRTCEVCGPVTKQIVAQGNSLRNGDGEGDVVDGGIDQVEEV